MVGHGGILAFDERTDMRALARHLLEFGAHESCGKCFPCRIGLQRGVRDGRAGRAPVDRERLEALLETLELGSLCAHGGGMPAPIRSLIAHFPDELGVGGEPQATRRPADDPYMRRPAEPRRGRAEEAGLVKVDDRRHRGRGRAGHHHPRGRAARPDRYVPTLCFDDRMEPFGACRVCMVGVEGAPGPLAACTTPCRDGHGGRHRRRDLAPHRRRHRRAGAVRAAASRPASTPSWPTVARYFGIGEPRWQGERRAPRARRPPPLPGRSSTSCASPAGAACAPATRSRARSR